MSISRAEELIDKLIGNKLSGKEWVEVLKDLHDDIKMLEYSEVLESYFDQLVKELYKPHS
jgi:superfamily II helicase